MLELPEIQFQDIKVKNDNYLVVDCILVGEESSCSNDGLPTPPCTSQTFNLRFGSSTSTRKETANSRPHHTVNSVSGSDLHSPMSGRHFGSPLGM